MYYELELSCIAFGDVRYKLAKGIRIYCFGLVCHEIDFLYKFCFLLNRSVVLSSVLPLITVESYGAVALGNFSSNLSRNFVATKVLTLHNKLLDATFLATCLVFDDHMRNIFIGWCSNRYDTSCRTNVKLRNDFKIRCNFAWSVSESRTDFYFPQPGATGWRKVWVADVFWELECFGSGSFLEASERNKYWLYQAVAKLVIEQ